MKIEVEGDELVSTYNNIRTYQQHWHFDTFSGTDESDDPVFNNFKFSFHLDPLGNIASITVPFEPMVKDIEFQRKADENLTDTEFLQKLIGQYQSEALENIEIFLQGDHLSLRITGQPQYELIPGYGTSFSLKGLSGFSVRFIIEEGEVNRLQINQPNGAFLFKRLRS